MKFVLLAGVAALGIGIGSAYAGEGDGAPAPTFFTSIPGVLPTPAVADSGNPRLAANQSAPAATAGEDTDTAVYATMSNLGIWLFPPSQGNGR